MGSSAGEVAMADPTDAKPVASFWRRRRKPILIGCGGLIALCAAAVGLIWVINGPGVSLARQQLASQALQNPAGARLHVGHYGDSQGWYSAGPTDYAVQDGMLIFPEVGSGPSLGELLKQYNPDVKMRAVVYAPSGADLSARPGPRAGTTWYYGDEWYLYDCHPFPSHLLWWSCALIVGGNI